MGSGPNAGKSTKKSLCQFVKSPLLEWHLKEIHAEKNWWCNTVQKGTSNGAISVQYRYNIGNPNFTLAGRVKTDETGCPVCWNVMIQGYIHDSKNLLIHWIILQGFCTLVIILPTSTIFFLYERNLTFIPKVFVLRTSKETIVKIGFQLRDSCFSVCSNVCKI